MRDASATVNLDRARSKPRTAIRERFWRAGRRQPPGLFAAGPGLTPSRSPVSFVTARSILHIAEALQHRRLYRFEIGSRSLLLHHEPLPRLQEVFELPHISRV